MIPDLKMWSLHSASLTLFMR